MDMVFAYSGVDLCRFLMVIESRPFEHLESYHLANMFSEWHRGHDMLLNVECDPTAVLVIVCMLF